MLISGAFAVNISIHALREEGDSYPLNVQNRAIRFLSTPSARRATGCRGQGRSWLLYFYPRPPRGGRPSRFGSPLTHSGFLSTPSARRATGTECIFAVCVGISIHALREEGDLC